MRLGGANAGQFSRTHNCPINGAGLAAGATGDATAPRFSIRGVAPGSYARVVWAGPFLPTVHEPATLDREQEVYFVLGGGRAIRYGIGVGRDGFTWSGVQSVSRMAEWPDWIPPSEMIARQPYLPRFMAGGPGNPLGARAMYLGGTVYRIHGTNNPATIGKQVSSGCIRLTNEDVTDLYERVQIGAKVVVLPMTSPAQVAQQARPQQVSMTQSYAPTGESNAQRTDAQRIWASIR